MVHIYVRMCMHKHVAEVIHMAGGWALSSQLCLEVPPLLCFQPASFSQVLSLGVTFYRGEHMQIS